MGRRQLSRVANPSDGSGYVPIGTVSKTIHALAGEYSNIGGVADWEDCNAFPGNTGKPIQWAAVTAKAMQ